MVSILSTTLRALNYRNFGIFSLFNRRKHDLRIQGIFLTSEVLGPGQQQAVAPEIPRLGTAKAQQDIDAQAEDDVDLLSLVWPTNSKPHIEP